MCVVNWLYITTQGVVMENIENDIVPFTIRIPSETFNTLTAYKTKHKPYMSLNALIVESIIEQLKRKTPEVQA